MHRLFKDLRHVCTGLHTLVTAFATHPRFTTTSALRHCGKLCSIPGNTAAEEKGRTCCWFEIDIDSRGSANDQAIRALPKRLGASPPLSFSTSPLRSTFARAWRTAGHGNIAWPPFSSYPAPCDSCPGSLAIRVLSPTFSTTTLQRAFSGAVPAAPSTLQAPT